MNRASIFARPPVSALLLLTIALSQPADALTRVNVVNGWLWRKLPF